MNNAQLLTEVTSDLLKNIGSLQWAVTGDCDLYKTVVGLRVFDELRRRLTKEEEVSQLEAQLIIRVAAFVKQNPRASEDTLVAFLRKELADFAQASKQL